jgi:hypothetical protein
MRAFAAATAALATLAFAAGATASIVPNRSIGGASLGQTRAQVRTKLGTPLSVKRGRNDFGRYTVFRYAQVTVTFQGNAGATALATTSAAQRTARGVGVGSTEAQVKARVRGVRCSSFGSLRHCTLGRELPGRRVTDFLLRRRRVVRVVVGFVID